MGGTAQSHSPPASPSVSVVSSGRKILTRLTSSFSNRSRNLSDFYIRPNDQYRHYSQGDIVRGAVCLTLARPVRITHLVLSLRGYVRVLKTGAPGQALDDPNWRPGRAKSNAEFRGDGYASIFQREVVLCGDGRLDARSYEFDFELAFPAHRLPSSIDFERGTISYILTATLTRPTTIMPTSTCDRKLRFVEVIDIGSLRAPKPRKISLEPIARRSKLRNNTKSSLRLRTETPGAEPSQAAAQQAPSSITGPGSRRSSLEPDDAPRSPVPSDRSSESAPSSSTGSTSASHSVGHSAGAALSLRSKRSNTNSSTMSLKSRTITATIELLRSGCLQGDSLPLKICVNHTKPIKSLHGVIVTFYRQSRIDSRPVPASSQNGKGKAAEDVYPKSKTGLGGLSLSSPSTSSVFRKDLSQTFAPLIVDPRSMTSVVRASVRVPEDTFPTIGSVPGAMISFKYFVEVVLDLSGKLAGQYNIPHLGTIDVAHGVAGSGDERLVRAEEGTSGTYSAWGSSVIDTLQIRREKSVVTCQFEVVLGTMDSSRSRMQRAEQQQRLPSAYTEGPYQAPSAFDLEGNDEMVEESQPQQFDDAPPQVHFDDAYSGRRRQRGGDVNVNNNQSSRPVVEVPLPQVEEEEGLDEKARMRLAETRLLPSRPPDIDGPSSAPEAYQRLVEPSAPILTEPGEVSVDRGGNYTWIASSPAAAAASSSVSGTPTGALNNEAGDGGVSSAMDDKQELERRRLQAEASSPGDDDGEPDAAAVGVDADVSSSAPCAPSAPLAPLLSDGRDGFVDGLAADDHIATLTDVNGRQAVEAVPHLHYEDVPPLYER
ncbi:MAG: hypothetical protein M1825_000168 [Sarcosagium campestre]|nr:MAG: hypothetical protein M1825_000168 [Sarcosagium campestre]